jgi:outer membrane usher protein
VLGTVGTLRGRVGVSTGPKGSGQHLELAYDYQGPRIGIQLSHEQSKDYWELASSNTFSLRPTTSTKASINWRNQDNSLGLRVSAVDQTANGLNTRFVEAGAKWNRNANSVDAGVLYDLDAHAPSLSLAFRHSFGSVNTSVAARVAPDVTQYAASVFAATKVKGMPLAVGLNAITDDRGNRSILAHGILVTSNGTVNAGVRQDNGRTTVNASMNGALHIGRGGIDALPYSGDGYAVVSIPGVEGVPVKLNNRVVGKTNKAGDLVIGPLASMVGTHVWIDDRALPAGVSLETSDAIAAPRRLAGALVTFPVRAMDARTFIVTLDGKPISAGSVAKSDQEETQVGFGGELFLEKGKAGQNITITHEKGSCSMKIPTPLPAFGDVVTLACQGK